MSAIRKLFWKKMLVVGDLLCVIGDKILIKSLDKLNDFDKENWLKTYNPESDNRKEP